MLLKRERERDDGCKDTKEGIEWETRDKRKTI
jgi:hypothetical protein